MGYISATQQTMHTPAVRSWPDMYDLCVKVIHM